MSSYVSAYDVLHICISEQLRSRQGIGFGPMKCLGVAVFIQ